VITFFPIKTDFKICVVAGKGSDFGAVEGEDVVDDCVDGLLGVVSVVNAEIVVEPFSLYNQHMLHEKKNRDFSARGNVSRWARPKGP
jgi:hypothetical protein